jgi:arginase family enzyme
MHLNSAYFANMSDFQYLTDFLEPVDLATLSQDEGYRDGQIGKAMQVYDDELPNIDEASVIIVGCPEYRGEITRPSGINGPNEIRREFYQLFYWHRDLTIADIGNIRIGSTLNDTFAALRMVIRDLNDAGKSVVILGGSHDLALSQYYAYAESKQIIEVVSIDAKIDLSLDSHFRSESFLMEMLTGEPNFIRHYSHIAFQSYLAHPRMLETMDKLRFDCFRLGHVRDNIEEMEPVIRHAKMVSFDISAIANAYAPANKLSPNGLTGEDACTLTRFAGLSTQVQSLGIYGYNPNNDIDSLTAMQISHMIWYFVDGRSRGLREATLDEKQFFNEFHTAFAEVETTFLQSKKTGRWWMRLPDNNFIPCSYNDYLLASSNEVPERWLRAQERS